jgi:aspartyl-tRNA(Asn)/glutamyl-tRNA(Gln) amidotransferase subunit C
MKIDHERMQQLARLAKISLTEDEMTRLEPQLTGILGFVEQLNEVPTTDVGIFHQVTGLRNVLRADEANYDFAPEDIRPTMPDVDETGHLRVHAVFKGESPSH